MKLAEAKYSPEKMFNKNEIYTKSNLLSLFRLLLAIPFWILLSNFDSQQVRYFTFALCLFAAFTDIMDGYLARKFNEVTEFGKIIDPLADKIAVGVIIIKLFLIGEIPAYYLLLILIRDILIFFGGLFVAKKIGKVLPSNILGKITVINIGIVILLIILKIDRENFIFIILFLSSILLMLASFAAYLIRAIEFMRLRQT